MSKAKVSQRLGLIVLLIVLLVISNYITSRNDRKASANDFSFVFMTDIHVMDGKNAVEGFQKAIAKVNELAPDFVITGGDLVMDVLAASEDQAEALYSLYKSTVEDIDAPVYNTIGNHEEFGIYTQSGIERDHPLYNDAMYEKNIGKRYGAFDFKGWRFYTLDAIEETSDRAYTGGIDSVQIAWLKEDLKQVSDSTPIVISTHIPFLSTYYQYEKESTASNPEGIVIRNTREVLDLFSDHDLKMVLQGHLHIVEEVYIDGIHFVTGGSVAAAWWDGPFKGNEEGFVKVDVVGGEIDWEYIDYGWEVSAAQE